MKKLFIICFLLSASVVVFAKTFETQFIPAHSKKGIDTTQIVLVGGIKQYIKIKGTDISKPILLFLHGGPGSSVLGFADKFTSKLKEHFIVVQWDQRETNKTLEMNSSPVPLKVSLFENDTKDLIDLLLKQFKQKKLYLVAHSWGSVLGFHIADKYPQLLYAYIAISPMINQLKSERITLKMLKQKAEELGNAQEIRELSLVQIPFENGKQLFYARKWLFEFNGQPIADKDSSAMIKYIANWSSTWLQVWNEALNKNLIKDIPKLNCPIYFFIGRKDYQTHFTLAEEYYNSLVATKKRLFWFEKSGHLIPNSEPALLQNIIIKQVLPETFSVL